jgi:6,7-dimethyl-8-ribityllumazine synthase
VSDTRHDDDPGRGRPYDHTRWDDDVRLDERPALDDVEELEEARENVFEGWPGAAASAPEHDDEAEAPEEPREPEAPEEPDAAEELDAAEEPAPLEERPVAGPEPLASAEPSLESTAYHPGPDEPVLPAEAPFEQVAEEAPDVVPGEHAPGELVVPPGYAVLEGRPSGERRAVAVVVSRFNGDVTTRLLESALAELRRTGVAPEAITVMPVPGAFELPLAAMALAKTRRYACVVALGCVIRGDTPHFDYVAGEAASGLQLAALETGVPVAFGVLTLEEAGQAAQRLDKGAEAVRTGLEMADAFANLRAAAAL